MGKRAYAERARPLRCPFCLKKGLSPYAATHVHNGQWWSERTCRYCCESFDASVPLADHRAKAIVARLKANSSEDEALRDELFRLVEHA